MEGGSSGLPRSFPPIAEAYKGGSVWKGAAAYKLERQSRTWTCERWRINCHQKPNVGTEQSLLSSDSMAHRDLRGRFTVGEDRTEAIKVSSGEGPADTPNEASRKSGIC